MASLLMIDDDVEFCTMIRDYIASYEFQLHAEHDAASGIAALRKNAHDLVLLDVMLPDSDGFHVIERIRMLSPIPVLMLSAEGSEDNRIAGLDRGADDYLPKPFNPRELVSRIHAILRRYETQRASGGTPARERRIGLTLNLASRQAFYRGERLPLTDIEFELLSVFSNSPGMVLDREALVNRVFRRPFNPLDRSLDMHVSRLRRKLAVTGESGNTIKTIRSSGYLYVQAAH